jgi:hypothetical protein
MSGGSFARVNVFFTMYSGVLLDFIIIFVRCLVYGIEYAVVYIIFADDSSDV